MLTLTAWTAWTKSLNQKLELYSRNILDISSLFAQKEMADWLLRRAEPLNTSSQPVLTIYLILGPAAPTVAGTSRTTSAAAVLPPLSSSSLWVRPCSLSRLTVSGFILSSSTHITDRYRATHSGWSIIIVLVPTKLNGGKKSPGIWKYLCGLVLDTELVHYFCYWSMSNISIYISLSVFTRRSIENKTKRLSDVAGKIQ